MRDTDFTDSTLGDPTGMNHNPGKRWFPLKKVQEYQAQTCGHKQEACNEYSAHAPPPGKGLMNVADSRMKRDHRYLVRGLQYSKTIANISWNLKLDDHSDLIS